MDNSFGSGFGQQENQQQVTTNDSLGFGNYESSNGDITNMQAYKIYDNVKIVKLEYVSKNDDSASYQALNIIFSRTTPNGVELHNEREYYNPIRDDQDKEQYAKARNWFENRLKHIAQKYGITLEELKLHTKANSFKEYCEKYCALVTPRLDDRLLYFKLGFNNNNNSSSYGRPQLPTFPSFLELMYDENGKLNPCTLEFTEYETKNWNKYKNSIAVANTIEIVDESVDLNEALDLN